MVRYHAVFETTGNNGQHPLMCSLPYNYQSFEGQSHIKWNGHAPVAQIQCDLGPKSKQFEILIKAL